MGKKALTEEETAKKEALQTTALDEGNGKYIVEQMDIGMLKTLDRILLPVKDRAIIGKLLTLNVVNRQLFYGAISKAEDGKPTYKPKGRWYSDGLSFQCMPSYMRRLIGHKIYHDIDIKNASATLMSQFFRKKGIDPGEIERYRVTRDNVFKQCLEQCKSFTPLHVGPTRDFLNNPY